MKISFKVWIFFLERFLMVLNWEKYIHLHTIHVNKITTTSNYMYKKQKKP